MAPVTSTKGCGAPPPPPPEPDCATENVLLAIVALSEREDVDVFWVHVTVVDPDPLPLVGETDNHEPLSDVLQVPPWQPLGDPVTATLCEPEADDGLIDDGAIVKLVQGREVVPDCVTENVLLAIVALSERDDVDVFCVHATVAEPDPLPLDGETESHELLSDVLQFPPWQPLGNPVTVTLCEPAADDGFHDGGSSVKLVQVADSPSWFTVNTFPAINAVAERDAVEEF